MATVTVSGTLGTVNPALAWKLTATETAASGTKRTIKVTLQAKVNGTSSSAFYGFPADYYFTVNGVKQATAQLKTSARWYASDAYRSFTGTYTVDAGTTSSKAIVVQVNVVSTGGWTGTGKVTLTTSQTNTAPFWGSGACVKIQQTNASGPILTNAANGTANAVKFPENISTLYLSWPAVLDKEGGTLTYEIYERVDNGSWSKISTTTNRYLSRAIGSGSSTQGKMYNYYVKAKDSGGLYTSTTCDATQVQKNSLTPATVKANGAISYDTTGIVLSWSGAKNTDGASNFTYQLSSSNITVYNQTVTGSSVTLSIYKSGATPSGPYIKFADIQEKLKSSNYAGTFSFVLTTTNGYGTSKTSSVSVPVDIRTNPSKPNSISTIFGTITVNNIRYNVAALENATISWLKATCPLGGDITYDVYYSYDNGSTYSLLKSGLATSVYSVKLPTVSSVVTAKFRVVARTAYGQSSNDSDSYTLHYVYEPTCSLNVERSEYEYKVTGTVNPQTSIPNVVISGGVKVLRNGVEQKDAADTNGLGFTYSYKLDANETETVAFVLRTTASTLVYEKDYTFTQVIQKYNPMFSIREKGIGVNCVNEGSEGVLKVNGNAAVTGNLLSQELKVRNFNNTVTIGSRSNDVSIHNNRSNKYLSLCNDGSLTYDSYKVYYAGAINKSGAWFNNCPVIINSSGKTDIGCNLDFHLSNGSTSTYDGRITLLSTNAFSFSGSITCSSISATVIKSSESMNISGSGAYNASLNINNTSSGVAGRVFAGDTSNLAVIGEAGSGLTFGANGRTGDFSLEPSGGMRVTVPITITRDITATGKVTGSMFICPTNAVYESTAGSITLRSRGDSNVYLQGSDVRVVKPLTTGTYRAVYASAFSQSSSGVTKVKIRTISNDEAIDTMQLLKSTNVYTYHLIDEVERGYYYNKKIGFIAEATPPELKVEDEQAIDLYSMTSTLWDVCRQQQDIIEVQQKQIDELTEVMEVVCGQLNHNSLT